jgi:hypothetical protein
MIPQGDHHMKRSLLFLLGMSLTSQVYAWGDLGHSTVGYLAEKNLTPEGQAFVYSVLGGEPLALSAIWPDHVRDDARYAGFAPYHFFEIPDGMNSETIPPEKRAPKSADTMIEHGPELIARSKSANRLSVLQKQIIMRYLVHIVGDVHQPLHVGNGQDNGANLCYVNFPDAETGKLNKTNLHSVWDEGIISYIQKDLVDKSIAAKKPIKYFSYRILGDAIIDEAKSSGYLEEAKSLTEKSTKRDWYSESRLLHSEVYYNFDLAPADRPYCKTVNLSTGKIEEGKFDENKIPEISNEYISKSAALIKKRLILGGLRLAKEINRIAKLSGHASWSAEKEAEFFKKVMPQLKGGRVPSSKTNIPAVEFQDWCHDNHH